MFIDLLLTPITAPINGLTWISEKILEQASPELDEKETLQKQLLTLQLAFDMGDVSETDFECREEELLLAIQALDEQLRSQAQDQ